jgi:hypothetical protein
MDFINFKFGLLLIFFLNGVNSLTEEEITSILYKFEKKIHEQLSEATRDIPGIKTAIQGTKVISGLHIINTCPQPQTTDTQRAFFQKSQTFGLGQTFCTEIS